MEKELYKIEEIKIKIDGEWYEMKPTEAEYSCNECDFKSKCDYDFFKVCCHCGTNARLKKIVQK